MGVQQDVGYLLRGHAAAASGMEIDWRCRRTDTLRLTLPGQVISDICCRNLPLRGLTTSVTSHTTNIHTLHAQSQTAAIVQVNASLK